MHLRPVPLPRRLAQPWPVVTVGTIAWFAAAIVLHITGSPVEWVRTCLAGGLLGGLGFLVICLQRKATRRRCRPTRHRSPKPDEDRYWS